jgi:hypothetical protein
MAAVQLVTVAVTVERLLPVVSQCAVNCSASQVLQAKVRMQRVAKKLTVLCDCVQPDAVRRLNLS